MTGEVCIANIGPRQRRRRLLLGIVGLVAGVVLALAAWVGDVRPALRLPLFFVFYGGFVGIFQARGST